MINTVLYNNTFFFSIFIVEVFYWVEIVILILLWYLLLFFSKSNYLKTKECTFFPITSLIKYKYIYKYTGTQPGIFRRGGGSPYKKMLYLTCDKNQPVLPFRYFKLSGGIDPYNPPFGFVTVNIWRLFPLIIKPKVSSSSIIFMNIISIIL